MIASSDPNITIFPHQNAPFTPKNRKPHDVKSKNLNKIILH